MLAVFLRHITVHRRRRITPGLQSFGQLCGGGPGAYEHEDGLEGFHFQDPGQRIQLVQATDQPVTLADGVGGGSAGLDGNFLRLVQMALCNTADFFRHGGREQCHLALLRCLVEDPFDIVDETHAQHLICLIQHQRLQRTQLERAFAHVVHHPSRGTDYHMHATLQLPYLAGIILATIDRQYVKPLDAGGIALKRLGDLDRQLTGWRQHHHLYLFAVDIEPRQQRQGKRSGLAGTGGGVTQQVQPLQQQGNGLGLDRGGGFVADLIEYGQQRRRQIQVAEAGDSGRGIGHRGFLVGAVIRSWVWPGGAV